MTTQRLGTVARERVYQLRKRQDNPEAYAPVKVGLIDLEFILNGGLPRVDPFYVAIIGRDKKGKSTVGNQVAWAYCEATGKKGCLYNLEENLNQGADRAMASRSIRVNRTHIYRNQLTPEDLDALELYASDIEKEELYINAELFRLDEILKDASEHGFEVIVIDNFQLLTDGKGKDQREKLAALSKVIMRARNEGKSFFLLSQGNADGKSFGSTQVQMDADICILIEERYTKENKKKTAVAGLRVLQVIRSRISGTGECDVMFQPEFSRVRTVEITKEDPNSDEFAQFEQYEMEMEIENE